MFISWGLAYTKWAGADHLTQQQVELPYKYFFKRSTQAQIIIKRMEYSGWRKYMCKYTLSYGDKINVPIYYVHFLNSYITTTFSPSHNPAISEWQESNVMTVLYDSFMDSYVWGPIALHAVYHQPNPPHLQIKVLKWKGTTDPSLMRPWSSSAHHSGPVAWFSRRQVHISICSSIATTISLPSTTKAHNPWVKLAKEQHCLIIGWTSFLWVTLAQE